MGSIPVAGAKKGELFTALPFLKLALRTHLRKRSAAELGSHFASLPDGSLLTVGASKDIREGEIPVAAAALRSAQKDTA